MVGAFALFGIILSLPYDSMLLFRVLAFGQLHLKRIIGSRADNATFGQCASQWHECWSSVVVPW